MKVLICFPFFADPEVALKSYQSFQVEDVDIYTIDDNAKPEVKTMIAGNHIPIMEENSVDNFATGCWNQAAQYFLEHPEYDCLRIGFSDFIMMNGWKEVLEANWDENTAILPRFVKTMEELQATQPELYPGGKFVTAGGTPADCVFLSRKLVEMVFPVPEDIKLWYNDEYIFTIMRETGHQVTVLDTLVGYHYGSLILQGPYVQESHDRIELDKLAWETTIKAQVWEKIKEINGQNVPADTI